MCLLLAPLRFWLLVLPEQTPADMAQSARTDIENEERYETRRRNDQLAPEAVDAHSQKRNLQTETPWLLESDDSVEIPPAEIADSAVLVAIRQIQAVPSGTISRTACRHNAEPVPVMLDGSTFAVHGRRVRSG